MQVNRLFRKRNERPLTIMELSFVSGVFLFLDMVMGMKYFVWLPILMGRCWLLRVRYQTFINSIRLNGELRTFGVHCSSINAVIDLKKNAFYYSLSFGSRGQFNQLSLVKQEIS